MTIKILENKRNLIITGLCPACQTDISDFLSSRYHEYPDQNFKAICPECSTSIEVDAELHFHISRQDEHLQKAA